MAIPSIVSGVADNLNLIILEEEVVSRGSSNEDRREVGERTGGTKTVERFVFQFQMDGVIGNLDVADGTMGNGDAKKKSAISRDSILAAEARSQLERSMRECLLRVLTLRKRRRRNDEKPENISFKLSLHVIEDKKQKDNVEMNEVSGQARDTTSCPELVKALRQGEWLQPEESSCLFSSTSNGSAPQQSSKGKLRPLKDVNLTMPISVDLPSCGMKMQLGMEVDP